MFRSGWSEPDNNSTTLALTPMSKKKDGFTNRLEELNYGLDFLEEVIRHTMDEYIESLRPPSLNANKSRRSSAVLESFKKFRSSQRGGGVGDIASPNSNIPTRTNSTPKGSSIRTPTTTRSSSTTQQLSRTTISSTNRSNSHRSSLGRDFDWEEARFIPMDTELIADIVETIRRITELVIIGERSHAQSNDRDTRTARENMSLFETFFERHGLATLTNLLLGNSFDILNHPAVLEQQYHRQQQEQDKASSKGTGSTTSTAGTEGGETDEEYRPIPIEDHVNYKLLPPLRLRHRRFSQSPCLSRMYHKRHPYSSFYRTIMLTNSSILLLNSIRQQNDGIKRSLQVGQSRQEISFGLDLYPLRNWRN